MLTPTFRIAFVSKLPFKFPPPPLSLSLSLSFQQGTFIPCGKFGLPYLSKATTAARVTLPVSTRVSVQYFGVSKQCFGCQCLGFLTEVHTAVDAWRLHTPGAVRTQWDCTESSVREESPLPHRGFLLVSCQYCDWLFSWAFIQLNHTLLLDTTVPK